MESLWRRIFIGRGILPAIAVVTNSVKTNWPFYIGNIGHIRLVSYVKIEIIG